ncbi:MAG: cytochrome c, partial [Parafilimonas terrae]|nr:cytochrome c [Parafilimonas terrae]
MRRALLTASVALTLPLCVYAGEAAKDGPKRGATLVEEAGCAGCHTATGGRPLGGGQVIDGADGPYVVPGITGGRGGLGAWPDAD